MMHFYHKSFWDAFVLLLLMITDLCFSSSEPLCVIVEPPSVAIYWSANIYLIERLHCSIK